MLPVNDKKKSSKEKFDSLSKLKNEERKLFVGGLSWETTENDVRDYFAKFGEVEKVDMKTDPNTGRSRGFSFVSFKNVESIDPVFRVDDHVIKNKKVDPKMAKLRPGVIYVGDLTSDITDDDLKNHFSRYGVVTGIYTLPFDRLRNRRKNCRFVTFESVETVYEIVKCRQQLIKDTLVEVEKSAASSLLPNDDDDDDASSRSRSRRRRGGGGRDDLRSVEGYALMMAASNFNGCYGGYYYSDYAGCYYGSSYGSYDHYVTDLYGYVYDYNPYLGGYDTIYPVGWSSFDATHHDDAGGDCGSA